MKNAQAVKTKPTDEELRARDPRIEASMNDLVLYDSRPVKRTEAQLKAEVIAWVSRVHDGIRYQLVMTKGRYLWQREVISENDPPSPWLLKGKLPAGYLPIKFTQLFLTKGYHLSELHQLSNISFPSKGDEETGLPEPPAPPKPPPPPPPPAKGKVEKFPAKKPVPGGSPQPKSAGEVKANKKDSPDKKAQWRKPAPPPAPKKGKKGGDPF